MHDKVMDLWADLITLHAIKKSCCILIVLLCMIGSFTKMDTLQGRSCDEHGPPTITLLVNIAQGCLLSHACKLDICKSDSEVQAKRPGLPQAAFRAEPRQVLFRDCEVGQSYKQLVTLHNCTPIGQRLM